MSAIAIASGGSALTPATGNINLFVATTGSDSNPGTALLPFATIQHAISVLLGFDYRSLYQGNISLAAGSYPETVNVPGGLFYGFHQGTNASGFITGDNTNPANVKVAPNNGTGNPMFTFSGAGFWQLDGVDLVADPSVPNGAGGNMIYVNEQAVLNYGTLNFETGTVQGYQNCFNLLGNALAGGGAGSGSGAVTFSGTGVYGQIFRAVQFSEFDDAPSFVFSSVMTIPNVYFANRNAFFAFVNQTFVTPGNVTATSGPFAIAKEAFLFLFGTDPTTIAWPGGAFNPSGFDALANADGFPYIQQSAGPLIDQSTIYRDAWLAFKDTNANRRYLAYDDGGTIYAKQIGRVPNTQTANYTLALSDQDGRVEMNLAGANTLTIPANATVAFPIGTEIRIVQFGAGATTATAAAGVTVNGVLAGSNLVGGQYKSVALYKRGTNEWVQTNV